MRVLFITIPFYEYIDRIKQGIQSTLNADVDVLQLGQESRGVGYILNKISKGRHNTELNYKNQERFFDEHKSVRYDYIFVLVGRGLNRELFYEFLDGQKTAFKIIYLWDDVKRVENFDEIKDAFDRIISFDRVDCEHYGFDFLPLFYCDDYRYNNENLEYDVSTIGFLHSDRIQILDKVLSRVPKEKYNWYAMLKTTRKHMLMECIKQLKIAKTPFYIGYKSLSIKETADIVKRSKVVLDMPHATQKGLSMRTIESIAAEAKLITTNSDVQYYDFYDENNVCIIDRKNPVVNESFFEVPYVKMDSSIVDAYSLKSWLKRIFSC